ncbi:MAG: hypothetical protein JNK87_11090 [Bryobacterales bacterium]|nr:hypothetical protein [Bryobacterales bacterium]
MEHIRGFHEHKVPRLFPGRRRRGVLAAAAAAAAAAGEPLPKELLDVLWSEPELRLRFLARLEQEEAAERDRHVQS